MSKKYKERLFFPIKKNKQKKIQEHKNFFFFLRK